MVVITCAQSQLLISWTNLICWNQGLIDNTVNKTVILICLCYIVFYMLITLLHDSRYIILYHGRCNRDHMIVGFTTTYAVSAYRSSTPAVSRLPHNVKPTDTMEAFILYAF
jgi:hypothetical protein